ncbi:MAG: FG-GAP repeat domain-containing protein [Gemmataceae bacterium]
MDLDADGHPDLLSGSWPGEIFFFRGGPGRTFAAPVKLKHTSGKAVNVGGGRRDDPDMVLIAGDATFEKDAKGKSVIRYDGAVIEIPEGKQAGITGTASAVHAADWDGDGRLDLLVGDIRGHVHVVPNEGAGKALAFGKERGLQAGGKPIRVPGGDAGPSVADWDGDGKPDLLVGAGDGSVWLYRNAGTPKEPKLEEGVRLVAPGEAAYGSDAPKEPRRGTRAKVWAADLDGDGRLDLLVGDYATQKPVRPEPTAAQKVEQEAAQKELAAVMGRYRKVGPLLFGPSAAKEKAEREKAQKEVEALMKRMQELRKVVPPEYEDHGWVWLFKRRPAGQP